MNYTPTDDGEFEEIPKDQFLAILEEEEERTSKELRRERVGFLTPQATRYVL